MPKVTNDTIENRIYTIRGKQVMLDSDLAELYKIQTKQINKAVKRNLERFPKDFMFQLTYSEMQILRCQFGTSSWGGKRYLPKAFTEQGIAMLSAVLRSKTAVEVSIKIMNAFVEMRKFLLKNAEVFQRLEKMEIKQIEYDKNFEKVFQALEDKTIPNKGIFFEGQVFDAYTFIADLIRDAKVSIILIDNYIDDSILTLFAKTKVRVIIYTNITKQLEWDYKKYMEQYGNVELKQFNQSHDRFLIMDNQVYHFGASLKDLGKKWFAFSKFDREALEIIDKLKFVTV